MSYLSCQHNLIIPSNVSNQGTRAKLRQKNVLACDSINQFKELLTFWVEQ